MLTAVGATELELLLDELAGDDVEDELELLGLLVSAELYKNGLNDPDNRDGAVTHLEPVTLEYEVMWASGSITTDKPSRGDGISAELFQILQDDSTLCSTCQ